MCTPCDSHQGCLCHALLKLVPCTAFSPFPTPSCTVVMRVEMLNALNSDCNVAAPRGDLHASTELRRAHDILRVVPAGGQHCGQQCQSCSDQPVPQSDNPLRHSHRNSNFGHSNRAHGERHSLYPVPPLLDTALRRVTTGFGY